MPSELERPAEDQISTWCSTGGGALRALADAVEKSSPWCACMDSGIEDERRARLREREAVSGEWLESGRTAPSNWPLLSCSDGGTCWSEVWVAESRVSGRGLRGSAACGFAFFRLRGMRRELMQRSMPSTNSSTYSPSQADLRISRFGM